MGRVPPGASGAREHQRKSVIGWQPGRTLALARPCETRNKKTRPARPPRESYSINFKGTRQLMFSLLRRLLGRRTAPEAKPPASERETPFWISFSGGESISQIRRKARNSLEGLNCPNPNELLSECYVVSAGRNFVPNDDYRTKPNDMIFFPRLAAAVSRLAAVTRLPPEGKQRDAQLAAEFDDWLKSGGLRRPGDR
jgi:hypothetical protein